MITKSTESAKPTYTLSEGAPVHSPNTSLRLNNSNGGGLVLLQDTQLIEVLAHFNRERIPERVVHAKAAGAHGYFEVTKDISDLTSANFLNGIGKKTPLLVRISTVAGEAGAADTQRDAHGWAMKLFTEEGNQDFVFLNMPAFFVRDPIKFPSVNRSHKRHPATHLSDWTMFWDYHANNPESIHQIMVLFTDRGTPKSLKNINVYGIHTYKLTKPDGSFHYVKFHFRPDAGNVGLTWQEAERLAGSNPDYLTQDLYEHIARGEYPSWTTYVQVMTPKEAEAYRWNVFDPTKVWSHKDYPLREFGKIVLDRNPENYFTEIEQAAFSPSTMVPGIGPSADPLLQARMFSYPDAARYRLGVNYQQLPTNSPISSVYQPYARDGFARQQNYGGDPNYVNSQLKPLNFGPESLDVAHDTWAGTVSAFATQDTDEDFVQPGIFWREVLGKQPGQQAHFVDNVTQTLKEVKDKGVLEGSIALFARVDEGLAQLIRLKLDQFAN